MFHSTLKGSYKFVFHCHFLPISLNSLYEYIKLRAPDHIMNLLLCPGRSACCSKVVDVSNKRDSINVC